MEEVRQGVRHRGLLISAILLLIGGVALLLPVLVLLPQTGPRESEQFGFLVGLLVTVYTASLWLTVTNRTRRNLRLLVFALGPWFSLGVAIVSLATFRNPIVALVAYSLVVGIVGLATARPGAYGSN